MADQEQSMGLVDRSSAGGDVRGGIYDVSTTVYDPRVRTSAAGGSFGEGQIDEVGGVSAEGAGNELVTFDVVEDNNTAAQYQWAAEKVD